MASSVQDQAPDQPQYPVKDLSFRIVSVCLCACCFISAFDTIILSTALPAIAEDLNASTTDAYWCSSAFLFAQSVVQLIYAVLAQAFDRRACVLAALAIFSAASVLCATARDVQWLIAARTLQGVGTGGINALIQLILYDIVPMSDRPKYTGIMTLFAAVALISGGLCGAAIVQRASWRIIFWINLPLSIPTFVGMACCLKVPKRQQSIWIATKKTDWVGAVLVTGSLAGILFALSSGNSVYPWVSAEILTPVACGCVGLVAFALYERLVAKTNAILPGKLFSNHTATSAYIMTIIHSMIVWTATYYFYLYLTFSSHSFVRSAVLMLPALITFPVSAGVTGVIIGRTLRYKALNIAGFVLLVSGLAGLTTLHESSPTGVQVTLMLVVGTGLGIPFIVKVYMAQTSVAEANVYMATALVSTATSFGECLGVAVASATFQNRWEDLLTQELKKQALFPVIQSHDAEKSAHLLEGLGEAAKTAYKHIAMRCLQTVWVVMTALAGLALILVVLPRELKAENKVQTVEPEVSSSDEGTKKG